MRSGPADYWRLLKEADAKFANPADLDYERQERRLEIRAIQQEMIRVLREHEDDLDLDDEYEYKFIKRMRVILWKQPLHVPLLTPRQAAFLKKTFKRYFKHSTLLKEYKEVGWHGDYSDYCDLTRDEVVAEKELQAQKDTDLFKALESDDE